MSTRDVLLGAAGRRLIDVDGEEEVVNLLPPASPERIAEIERELGFALPGGLSELLHLSAGLDMLESFDLASIGSGLLDNLTKSLEAFYIDMLGHLDDYLLVCLSEFGRHARENGSIGTDHGHGNAMFVMGDVNGDPIEKRRSRRRDPAPRGVAGNRRDPCW